MSENHANDDQCPNGIGGQPDDCHADQRISGAAGSELGLEAGGKGAAGDVSGHDRASAVRAAGVKVAVPVLTGVGGVVRLLAWVKVAPGKVWRA